MIAVLGVLLFGVCGCGTKAPLELSYAPEFLELVQSQKVSTVQIFFASEQKRVAVVTLRAGFKPETYQVTIPKVDNELQAILKKAEVEFSIEPPHAKLPWR